MSHKTAVPALQHKPAPPSVLMIGEKGKSHISEWVIPREAGNGHLLPFGGGGGLMNGHGKHLKDNTQIRCNEGPRSSVQIWSVHGEGERWAEGVLRSRMITSPFALIPITIKKNK